VGIVGKRAVRALALVLGFVTSVTALAEKKAKAESSGQRMAGAEFSVMVGVPGEAQYPVLDGGHTRGFVDFSFDGRLGAVHSRTYGTAAAWRKVGYDDSIWKLDRIGAELVIEIGDVVDGKGFGIKAPIGAYLPLPWNSDVGGLYRVGHGYGGIGLFLDAGLFRIDGGGVFYKTMYDPGEIERDNVTIALYANDHWQAKLSGRSNILDLFGPVGEIGAIGYSGATLKTPMGKSSIKSDSVMYANFGVAVMPGTGKLAIEARVNRVLGEYDAKAIQFATGRRTIMELIDGYSIGIVGRL
jgi:hypothetical protein